MKPSNRPDTADTASNTIPALLHDGLKCNILLAGRTGSGKSSFANYLFGVEQFTTGNGKPVTSWAENFQQYSLMQGDMTINVFDSVGLEPDNFSHWIQDMERFLASRAHDKTSGSNDITHANELLHHVYYIVNGAGARLLDQEIQLLESFTDTWKLNVSLIVTNSDCATEEQLADIEERASGKGFETIRVCSISRNTRGGAKTLPFGREEAIKKLLESSYERVGSILTEATLDAVLDFIEELRQRTLAKIDRENINIISLIKDDNMDDFLSYLGEELDELTEDIDGFEDLLPPEYHSYYTFLESFDVSFRGKEIFEETFKEFNAYIESIEIDDLSGANALNRAMETIEEGNLFDKIGAAFELGGKILFIKKTIKDVFNEMIDTITDKIEELRDGNRTRFIKLFGSRQGLPLAALLGVQVGSLFGHKEQNGKGGILDLFK